MSEVLSQYVVYDHPRDFPNCFVVRRWRIYRGAKEPTPDLAPLAFGPSLDLVRSVIPDGLVNIGRCDADDETILEVWT